MFVNEKSRETSKSADGGGTFTVKVALELTATPNSFDTTTEDPKKEPEPGAIGLAQIPRLSTVFARSNSSSQNLVLQIRVGDLAAYTNGGTAELRKRARINRY